MTTVSKYPSGSPSVSWAAWVRSSTFAASSGSVSTCARSAATAAAERSVPQYASQSGAIRDRIRPLPTPISNNRRTEPSSRMRSTVAARHSRISSTGIGVPSYMLFQPA